MIAEQQANNVYHDKIVDSPYHSAMELGVIIGIVFLAWLMWSSKNQKESFLFYLWSFALVAIVAEGAYHLLLK